MIRLILRLLGIRDFEVCASCETLKQQLAFERDEKKQLTEMLLAIVQPKQEILPQVENLQPIRTTATLFSHRRAALEAKDREEARILKQSPNLGKPDTEVKKEAIKATTVEELEKELGVEEKEVS